MYTYIDNFTLILIIIWITLVLFYFLNFHILANKNVNTNTNNNENNNSNDMEWNLRYVGDKIRLISLDYKYIIEIIPQKIEQNMIYLYDRNNNSEYQKTDYKCNILKREENFKENNFLILNNISSSRYNIISYKGLPKIYKYNKRKDHSYDCLPNLDVWTYGFDVENLSDNNEIPITDKLINKLVTKSEYVFPEILYLV